MSKLGKFAETLGASIIVGVAAVAAMEAEAEKEKRAKQAEENQRQEEIDRNTIKVRVIGPEKYFSFKEAAEFIGRTEDDMRRYARIGYFKAEVTGRGLSISQTEFDKFIKNNKWVIK